jgi:hypothetical protein
MGISSSPHSRTRKDGEATFSKHTLKIELTGPARQNLTMIDVPGIFRNSIEGITTDEDVALVNDMVLNYIRDERTIILAVLAANVDIATQGILNVSYPNNPIIGDNSDYYRWQNEWIQMV